MNTRIGPSYVLQFYIIASISEYYILSIFTVPWLNIICSRSLLWLYHNTLRWASTCLAKAHVLELGCLPPQQIRCHSWVHPNSLFLIWPSNGYCGRRSCLNLEYTCTYILKTVVRTFVPLSWTEGAKMHPGISDAKSLLALLGFWTASHKYW